MRESARNGLSPGQMFIVSDGVTTWTRWILEIRDGLIIYEHDCGLRARNATRHFFAGLKSWEQIR